MGARGATYDELARMLAPDADLDRLGRALATAAELDHVDVAVANTLWMRFGLEFRDTYQQAVLGWSGGALHTADFGGDPERSRVRSTPMWSRRSEG
jgi:serine protease inhibitor